MNLFAVEKAMLVLAKHYPETSQKKPAFFHSMRVLTYLYHNNYSETICVAWVLHDALEDTDIQEQKIEELFWKQVLAIVKANSKNTQVAKEKILEDIVQKCVSYWEDALIVKVADVYDNFLYYTRLKDSAEQDRCKYLAQLIKKHKPIDCEDPIFELLDVIIN